MHVLLTVYLKMPYLLSIFCVANIFQEIALFLLHVQFNLTIDSRSTVLYHIWDLPHFFRGAISSNPTSSNPISPNKM